MSTFLLVHGAWHGAWCWYKLAPRLERAGHRVVAPDLAGLGRDQTPLKEVSLAGWADQIARQVESEREAVTLVGHSRAGIVISEVAERCPERLERLVYLAAFLPRDGQCLVDLAQQDADSLIPPNRSVSPDGLSTSIRPEAEREIFYGQCPDEDVWLAKRLLRPEPLAPLATPIRISAGRHGRVPRSYVLCLRDRAVSTSLQRHMLAATPCERVLEIDTDHSPFLSRPDELATLLGSA